MRKTASPQSITFGPIPNENDARHDEEHGNDFASPSGEFVIERIVGRDRVDRHGSAMVAADEMQRHSNAHGFDVIFVEITALAKRHRGQVDAIAYSDALSRVSRFHIGHDRRSRVDGDSEVTARPPTLR